MKASELTIGIIVLIVGGLLLGSSFSYPELPGQAYGAGTFPRLLGVCGLTLGLLLIAKGWAKRSSFLIGSIDEWVRHRHALGVLGVLASIVFFILAAPSLGFIVSAVAILFIFMFFGGVKLPLAVGASLTAALVIYFAFSHLLLIPLPRGAVENLLW